MSGEMMTGFVQAAVVGAGVEGGTALRCVIQASVDPLKWRSEQEKMYCDSIKLL